jgi:hypothetical protein
LKSHYGGATAKQQAFATLAIGWMAVYSVGCCLYNCILGEYSGLLWNKKLY